MRTYLLLIPLTGLLLLAAGCGQTTKQPSQAAEEPKPDNELRVKTTGWKTDFSLEPSRSASRRVDSA